jgi:hypothetical protein
VIRTRSEPICKPAKNVRVSFLVSTQNKAATAPITPAMLKLLRARLDAPPLLPVLLEEVGVVEVLVELPKD